MEKVRSIDPAQAAVGKRVRDFREALQLSQEAVAERSEGGLDRIRVNKLEKGGYQLQTDRARLGLARAFGLSLDDLYDLMHGHLSLEAAIRRSKVAPRAAS